MRESSSLTCQEKNVTPANRFEPRKSICKRTQTEDGSAAQNIFSICVPRLHKIVPLSLYVSTRIHTPLMATTASGTDEGSRSQHLWRQQWERPPPRLHMVYWKALDFTSRWTPRRRKRGHDRVKQTDVFHCGNVIKVEGSLHLWRWGRSCGEGHQTNALHCVVPEPHKQTLHPKKDKPSLQMTNVKRLTFHLRPVTW